MLLEELLFEMPQSIEPTEFNLNNEDVNRRMAFSFLRDNDRELLEDNHDGTELYKVKNQIALVDQNGPRVLYYVRWKDVFHKFVGKKAASQIAVWRNEEVPITTKLAPKVFFDYLLPIYGVIITDTMQTPDGKRFWVRRIADVFEHGLNVYYLNLLPASNDIQRELIKIKDVHDFEKLNKEKQFWGQPELFRARKLLITDHDL